MYTVVSKYNDRWYMLTYNIDRVENEDGKIPDYYFTLAVSKSVRYSKEKCESAIDYMNREFDISKDIMHIIPYNVVNLEKYYSETKLHSRINQYLRTEKIKEHLEVLRSC